uniref:hypothetical protein n=1 Tax=Thalassolituus sp. TaxID=2030822 RepID=UPI003512774D
HLADTNPALAAHWQMKADFLLFPTLVPKFVFHSKSRSQNEVRDSMPEAGHRVSNENARLSRAMKEGSCTLL